MLGPKKLTITLNTGDFEQFQRDARRLDVQLVTFFTVVLRAHTWRASVS